LGVVGVPIDMTYYERFRNRVLDAKAWDDTAIQLLETA
jgi:hypothetical protein